MRRYILLILLSITTGVKAQTFTGVNPTITNFDGIYAGSIDWGDYDNDGDLDVLLTGQTNASTASTTRIYRNRGDGTFENTAISLPVTHRGQAAWGDYDNDGDLDIIIAGLGAGRVCSIYRNKGNGTFENSGNFFEGMLDCAVAWGDYDNDGYLDLLITGINPSNTIVTRLYRNKRDGTFENSGIPFTGVRNNARGAAWGDYDNDGNLDFVVSGTTIDLSANYPLTKIYHNKGDGTFEDSNIPLPGLWSSTVAWGDYDNDGDQDLLLTGRDASSSPITKIYRNKGDGTFEDAGILFPNNYYVTTAWGDYDNDGDLDIVLTGLDANPYPATNITKIYRNKGDGTFEDSGISMPDGYSSGSISWGDYDNDGDLDLLLAGYSSNGPSSRVFINNSITPNTKPNAPTGLQTVLSPDGTSATLSWQKATDAETPQNGLSYNIYVSEQRSSHMANITNGYRRIAATGNRGTPTSYTIKGLIPGKKYYWSVQTIDAAFAGSAFAIQQELTPPLFEKITAALAQGTYCWGDYDNDGDLDALVTSNILHRIYRNKGDGTFENSGQDFPLTTGTISAWGDYDNDGYLDILLAGSATKVYHNKRDGTFEDAGIVLPAIYRGAAAWCDYDNDGDQDIILTGNPTPSFSSTFSKIYRNKGDGTFEDSAVPLTGLYSAELIWKDFDNDGDQDLIMAGFAVSGQTVTSMYRNKGDGTFETGTNGLLPTLFASMAAGDYDNDGDLDLLMTGLAGAPSAIKTTLYRNRGDGTFDDTGLPFTALQNGIQNGSTSFGDYDNDGYLDILVSGYTDVSNTPFTTRIYHNKGDGTFEDAAAITPAGVGLKACWVDYDNDNDLDLIMSVGQMFPVTYGLYKNKILNPNTKPTVPTGLQVTISADSRSAVLSWQKATDGQTAQNGLYYNVYISETPGAVTRQSPLSDISNGFRKVVSVGNAGSKTSYTIKELIPGKKYYWSVQAVDGAFAGSAFAAQQEFTSPLFTELSSAAAPFVGVENAAAWGDYDNDGDLDVVVNGTMGGGSSICRLYRNKGDGTFEDSRVSLASSYNASAKWADYDNDGYLDLMLGGDQPTKLYHNKGDGTFEENNNTAFPLANTGTFLWSDFDNDGHLDVFFVSNSIGALYRNKGDGTFENTGNTFLKLSSATAASGDYDNDGDQDILVIGQAAAAYFTKIYRNKGDGTFEDSGVPLPGVASANAAAWGDYDNDGDLDILIAGAINGTSGITRLYRNNGDGTFSNSGTPLQNVLASALAWGDYDSDGYLDILLTGYATPANYYAKIYHNKRDGTFEELSITLPGVNAGAAAWMDYDNDGDLDFFVSGSTGVNRVARIYTNNINILNTKPQAPAALQAVMANDSTALLSWQKATDAETPQSGLNYNVYVSDVSGATNVQGPMANISNGYRRIPATGNTIMNSDTIKGLLPGKTYYWSVQAIDAAYAGSPFATEQSFTTRALQTISFSNITATYGDADITPAATTTSSLPLDFSSDNSSVATIVGGKIHITGAGTANITAAQAGNASIRPADVKVTITVSKKMLTVTGDDKTITYGDALPTHSYVITGFVPGETEAVFTAAVSITGTGTNVGTYPITVSGAAAANYDFTYQPATLTINRKLLTVTADNKTITYGDAQPTLTYGITGFVPGETASIFTTPVNISGTGTNVGTYPITVSGAAAGNYDFSYQGATLTIQKATTPISFNALPAKIYGDADFNSGATISNGLPITYSTSDVNVATIVNGNIHITGAGTVTITAHQVGDNNHYPATDVPVTFTVNKKQLTVTAADKTITFGDALPILTYNITGFIPGETESVFSIPVSITTNANGDAGTFNITVSGAAADDYDLAYQQAHLTVLPATAQISFNSLPVKTYGDADFNAGAIIGNGLPITYSSTNSNVATIINNNIHITGAGTTTITAHQPGNSNYNAATDVPVTFTVNKKQLTVTAEDKTQIYGEPTPALTYVITGLLPSETETIFTTPVSITGTGVDAGTYPITVSNATAANYDFAYQAGTLSIQKATVNISFTTLPVKTYGDADFNPGATISNGLPVTYTSTGAATIVNNNIHITGAGTATITAHQAGNANYNPATDVSVTLTINKKQLTVTAADKAKLYGEPAPVLTYIISGLANGETETVFTTPINISTSGTNVGTYPIAVSGALASNYDFTYQSGTLNILKAVSQITFNNLPVKTYGDADFNANATADNRLPVTYFSANGNVATIINGNIHITGAGSTLITASQPGNNNYTAAPDVSLILIVNKRRLTVIPADQTKIYGDPTPVFNYTVTGFVPGEDESVFTFPLYVTSAGINAGTYPITASNAAAANYYYAYQTGTLTIYKASQTLTFNGLPVKTYGDADFNANAISGSGLPITYTSSNGNVATIVNGNIHITGAGTATITASQPGNNNYNAGASISQQLIVNKAAQTIQFAPMAAKTKGGTAFDPGARASSGLPIIYVIENTSIATLNGDRISPTRSGFTKVTATQPGDNNYEPALPVEQELEITTGNQLTVQDAVTPNGDGINDYLLIEGIRQYPDNQLYISNAQGKIVFEAKGYNNTNNIFRGFAGAGSTRLSKGVYYYVLFYGGKKQSGFFILEY